MKLGTRAVELQVEPGNSANCEHCGDRIKFVARLTRLERRQIVANIYVKKKWNRVEHFHRVCYDKAGEPHGPVVTR